MTDTTQRYEPQVGDVFVESWGYDQTNVNAYQVVSVTKSGKSVRVREVRLFVNDENRVVPERGVFRNDDEPTTKRLRRFEMHGEERVSLTMSSYSNAYLWDGVSSFHESYAAGDAGH